MSAKRFLPYMLISVCIHISLLYFLGRKAEENSKPKEKKVLQVSIVEIKKKEEKPDKRIVSIPKHNNKEPEEADYLSEENNSVKEETVSRAPGEPLNENLGEGEGENNTPKSDGEVNLFPQDAISDIVKGKGGSGTGSNDYVEGEKEGDQTALNTVEFKYASFFNRVKRDLSTHWYPLPIIYREDPTGDRILYKNRQTVLYLTLDAEGNILDIQIHQSSEVRSLDNEAIAAVRRCKQFPNPPKGLIKNGKVQFYFGFIVYNGGGFLSW